MKRLISGIAAVLIFAGCTACKKGENKAIIKGYAMDTSLSVAVYSQSETDAKKTASAIQKSVSELENIISWNVDSSAVSKLNESGSAESQTLADIIRTVNPLCTDSGGEFSLLMRPLCELWNVTAEHPKVPDKAAVMKLLPVCSGKASVNGNVVNIPTDAKLDLGAVGKGAACDRAAAVLKQDNASGIVSVGGSIAVFGSKPDGSDWSVSISDPDDINRSVGTLSIDKNCFISTSGDGERYFIQDGKRYHHIISGISGYPAETGLRSVTVLTDSGLMSDALSTVCFLLGYEKSLSILQKYGAEAVFITNDGSIIATDGLKSSFKSANKPLSAALDESSVKAPHKTSIKASDEAAV